VGSLYTGPITFGQTLSFKAIAYGPGITDSSVASATLAITSITSPQGVATVAISGSFDVLAIPVGTPTAINIAAWSVINGQDDLEWTPSTNQGGGVWKGSVNLSHHRSSGADYGLIGVHVQQTGGPSGDLFLGGADLSRYLPNIDVENPGFETGSLASWNTFSASVNSKSGSAARSGSYGLNEASGDGGVYQDFDGLLPGKGYTVRAWVKSPDVTPPPVMLWVHDTTGANMVNSGTVFPSGTWQQLTVNYTANSIGRLRVHLQRATGGGAAYWDDVTISTPSVANPGFETGSLASWNTFSTSVNSTIGTAARSGSYGLNEASGDGGAYQDFDGLLAGNVYTVRAWVRSPDATPPPVELWVHDTTGANVVGSGVITPSGTWQQLTVSYTANSIGRLRVHLQRHTGAGAAYWDDVSLSSPALSNPGFETGAGTSWTAFSGVQASVTSSLALTGTNSYSLSSGEGGVYQDVTGLNAGQVYIVEGWARASST
jgi:hypothetical protein